MAIAAPTISHPLSHPIGLLGSQNVWSIVEDSELNLSGILKAEYNLIARNEASGHGKDIILRKRSTTVNVFPVKDVVHSGCGLTLSSNFILASAFPPNRVLKLFIRSNIASFWASLHTFFDFLFVSYPLETKADCTASACSMPM
ncbi:hypothetical protein PM082_004969 [Marasmius tenuissimus]|nr:hypothetical protein PM082_004969 [Marasmius tenuissimus]